MTLREFTDAAFAFMVRTFLSIPGTHLLQAIEQANEAFGIERSEEQTEAAVEAQNEASLRQLQAMMAGV